MSMDAIKTLNDADLMDLAANSYRLAYPPGGESQLSLKHQERYQQAVCIAQSELEIRIQKSIVEWEGATAQ